MSTHERKGGRIWITVSILFFNGLVIFFLMYQIKAQRNAYLTLRSEDGFLLMDMASRQLIDALEDDVTVSSDIRTLLNRLAQNRDVDFVLFQDTTGTARFSQPTHLEANTDPSRDSAILEAIYANEPFTRLLHLADHDSLECIWPLYSGPRYSGVLRVGLSVSFVNILNRHFGRTMGIAVALILLLNGAFLLVVRLNRKVVRDGQTFRTVLNGISDGVLIRQGNETVLQNGAFRQLFPDRIPDALLDCTDHTCHITIDSRRLLVLRSTSAALSIFIVRDVSIERIAEETTQREKRLFSMGKLSSVFAHEIRNPLNTISMIVQQMQIGNGCAPEERELLDIVSREIDRLNEHVQQYIRISRLPAIQPKPTDMRHLLTDVVRLYRQSHRHVELSVEPSSETMDVTWSVDSDQLRSMLTNLLDNSIHAGATRIRLILHRENDYLVLRVTDNGSGMSEEIRERAFELYYTTRENGSGLGLPHVQRIMTAHNGLVSLVSEPGNGTEIQLYFPVEGGRTA